MEFTHQLEVGGRGQGARCHRGEAGGALYCLCLPPNDPGQVPRPPLKHKQVVSDHPEGRFHLSYSVFKMIRGSLSTCYMHMSLYWGWVGRICVPVLKEFRILSLVQMMWGTQCGSSQASPMWSPSCPHLHIIRFAVAVPSDTGLFDHVYLEQQQTFFL